MSIVTGRIDEFYLLEGTIVGKVNIRGAFMTVPLTFLPRAIV